MVKYKNIQENIAQEAQGSSCTETFVTLEELSEEDMPLSRLKSWKEGTERTEEDLDDELMSTKSDGHEFYNLVSIYFNISSKS